MNKQIAVYDNTISAREYLSYISEQAGGFATIGRDGKLYIKTMGEDIAALPLKYFKDFKWGEKFKISCVRYEDGVQLFEKGNDTGNTVYLSQDNIYIVEQSQIDNIYNRLNELEIYSFEGTSIIDPALDVGDLLLIDGKYVIYQGSLEYSGKFKANISSKIQCKAKEETTVRIPSQKTINRRVKSEINQIDGKITQIISEQDEYDSKLTEVEQDIDSIKQRVENVLDFTREQTAKGMLHLTECKGGTEFIQELSIRDLQYLTPSATLTPNEQLVPFSGQFTLVIDKANRLNKTENALELVINLEESLLRLNDEIYDEISINENGEIKLIRRVNYENGVYSKLESEQVKTIGNIDLPTFDPDTYIYIKENSNMTLYTKYIIKNEFDEKYATKLELSSSITQTSQQIMSEVNKKVNEEELGTKIQQNAEAIKIAWNQISQYLQMEGIDGKATLNIYDKDNNMLMSLGQDGEDFFDTSGNRIGRIGIVRENNKDTLAFIMDIDWDNVSEAKSMAWGYNDKNGNFLPIFHLVGSYGEESSEYGGDIEVVGNIITNNKVGNENSYIDLSGASIHINFANYLKITSDVVDFNLTQDPYSNIQMHLKANDTNIFRLYQNDNFDNVINLDDTKFFASNVPWSDDISAFTGSPNSHLIATFKDGGSVCVFADSSDKRLKKNIKDSDVNGLDTISKIKHRQYNWKRDNLHENIGYVAQELEKIDERLIRKTKIGEDYDYQINTLNVLAVATKAIQELNDKVNKQEVIIDNLVKEINQLKEDINGKNSI